MSPNDLLAASSFDLARFAGELRRSTYAAFRRRMEVFGKALAGRISLSQAVVGFNKLFEICIGVLLEDEARRSRSVSALSRLYALAGLMVVSSYTSEWNSRRKTLAEASILEAEDYVHWASAYVMRIYERELHRLAQNLHVDLEPALVRIQLCLELIEVATQGKDLPAFQPRLAEAIALVSSSIESVRRIGMDLGSAVFEDLGFLPAIRIYTQEFSARTKINVVLREGYIPEAVPMIHQVALYRLIQGALANVLKGASVKNVAVSLESVKDSVLVMVIEDDGAGLDVKDRRAFRSSGLTAMRERVESLGGRIHIESRRAGPASPEHGTRIEVELPLPGGGWMFAAGAS